MWAALAIVFFAAPAPEPESVDHLALAALLVRDGHYDRASQELAQLDPDAPPVPGAPPLDRQQYWTLRGVVALHDKDHLAVARSFERALEHGATEPSIPVFIAQAYLALEQWEVALAAFERIAPAQLAAEPKLELARANALWRAGRSADTHAALGALVAAHPQISEAWRLWLVVLTEAGLHRAAAEVGRAWLAQPGASADDHLAAAESLRRAGAYPEALAVLTEATLRYPHGDQIQLVTGRTLLDAGQPLAAALVLERVALQVPERALDAAELYRRAGRLERALWLNARVPDPSAKLRQRLGLLVDLERFEEVAALGDRVLRLGLGTDDMVVYGMAYACFRVGDHAAAERWLTRITSPDLFEKAAGLRKTMAVCAAEPSRCE